MQYWVHILSVYSQACNGRWKKAGCIKLTGCFTQLPQCIHLLSPFAIGQSSMIQVKRIYITWIHIWRVENVHEHTYLERWESESSFWIHFFVCFIKMIATSFCHIGHSADFKHFCNFHWGFFLLNEKFMKFSTLHMCICFIRFSQ